MHERGIAAEIIAKAKEYGKVKGITVEVGNLAHLPADEMLDVLKEMTTNWEVSVTRKEAKVKCSSCGYEGKPTITEHGHGFAIFKCPTCGEVPKVLEGQNITLIEVDVKD